MKIKRAKRAIAQTPHVTDAEQSVAHFAGWNLYSTDPGVPLPKPRFTPGFTLSPRSAGSLQTFHQLVQSFL
jgi:hypothetical protein